MSPLDAVAYAADAFILGTYALTVFRRSGRALIWFHGANAIGGLPLLAVEAATHAWPVMPLTAAFTLLGWNGLLMWKVRS